MKTLSPLAWCLSLLLVVAVALGADSTLEHARRAQMLLGPEAWSRIIAIENSDEESRYPRKFHALVFELEGILWFYTALDGTQSFSLHVGQVEEEKKDFAELLRAIDPGFRRWREIDPASVRVTGAERLRNGCLIESVVALRDRLSAGHALRNPRLLFYYVNTATGLHGHTVLAYEARDRVEIFDAAQPLRRIRLPVALGEDPVALAQAFEGPRVVRARELPLAQVAAATVARAEPMRVPAAGEGASVTMR